MIWFILTFFITTIDTFYSVIINDYISFIMFH